jgi:hypothetical protein
VDPDPPDPYIFGPPGSGFGSFYLLFDFLTLKNDVNVPSKSNKQKNFFKN